MLRAWKQQKNIWKLTSINETQKNEFQVKQ